MDRLLHDMVCHGWTPALDLFGSQKICPLGIAAHAGQTKLREAAPKIPTARPRNLPAVQTHCSRAVFPASGFSPLRGSGVGIMILLRLLHFSWEAPKPAVNRQISSFLHLLTLTDNGSSDCGSCFHLMTRSFSFNTTSPILTTLNPDDVVSDAMYKLAMLF